MMKLADLSVNHAFADVGGIKLHYVHKGEGPLVLLLHGFPELWWSWRYQIDAIAAAGFHVVAPDLRGYNESDKQGPYDIDTLATDVRALIAHLGYERAIITAHDWGGAVGWRVASTMPHLVEKLAVLNCPHPAQMQRALFRSPRQLRRSWYMFFFLLPSLPERFLMRDGGAGLFKMYRAMAMNPANFSDEELAPFAENILRPGAAHAMVGWYRAAMRQGLAAGPKGVEYPTITAPTLLLWAKDDKALGYDDVVPGTERFVSDLRLDLLENCGHFVQAEQPDRVNRALIDFYRRA